MVPIALSLGIVAPSILRPSRTAFFPSQTMAQTLSNKAKVENEKLDMSKELELEE
jgi:hypothetical protein